MSGAASHFAGVCAMADVALNLDAARRRKCEAQRERRRNRVRIDYMPSDEALRILLECRRGTLSNTIDNLILAADENPCRRLPVR